MKRNILIAAGGVISVACIYWIFRQLDLKELGRALGSFELIWLGPAIVIYYVSMYLRAVRWAYFFRPRYQFDGRKLITPLMICFSFNGVFPSGRVGEVVRAFYVGQREKTGVPMALATIVTERIFDGVTLLICLGVSLAILPPIDPLAHVEFWGFEVSGEQLRPLLRTIAQGCVVLVVGVVIFMIPAVPVKVIAIIQSLRGIPEKARSMAVQTVEGLAIGFESVRDPRNLAWIVFYSMAIWGLIGLSNLVLAFGFSGIEMNFMESMALVALIASFVVIPSAPGYWGLYEAGGILGLTVLGLATDQSTATAYIIVMHLIQYVPTVVIGLILAARSGVRGMNAPEAGESIEPDKGAP